VAHAEFAHQPGDRRALAVRPVDVGEVNVDPDRVDEGGRIVRRLQSRSRASSVDCGESGQHGRERRGREQEPWHAFIVAAATTARAPGSGRNGRDDARQV